MLENIDLSRKVCKGDYKKMVDEMLFRTSSPHAPWTIIESNNKHFARIKVLKTMIDAIEKRL